MIPHRLETVGLRTVQVSGALLAGALLAGCGQQSNNVDAASVPVQQASTRTPATSAPSTTGNAAPSSTSTPTSTMPETNATTSGTSHRATAIERCHTSMLDGSLQQGSPGAGQRYAQLSLRNTGDQACTIHGYSGLQLVGSNGQALPTDVNRVPGQGPETVRLAPGEATSATLHWGVVPTGDEPTTGPCGYQPSRMLVIPPDETDQLTVDWTAGRVCGGGSIDITAFR